MSIYESSSAQSLKEQRLERQNDILKTALRNLISVCKALDPMQKYTKFIDAAIAALEGK